MDDRDGLTRTSERVSLISKNKTETKYNTIQGESSISLDSITSRPNARDEPVQRDQQQNENEQRQEEQHPDTSCSCKEIITYIFTAYWPWDKVRKMVRDNTGTCFGCCDCDCCCCLNSPLSCCPRLGQWCRTGAITLAILLHVSFIIAGVLYQSAICFSRQNPYAHLRRSLDYNESLDNSSNHCILKCDIDKSFVNGFFVPDIAIVLISLWMHLIEKFIIICLKPKFFKWACKESWLYKSLEELTIFSAEFEKLEESNEELMGVLTIEGSTVNVYSSVISLLYIFCSLALDISYLFVFDFLNDDLVIQSSLLSTNNSKNFKIKAIILSILGFIAIDLLYIQVITRYAYRCDFAIRYLKSIIKYKDDQQLLKEKVEKVYDCIRKLNKSTITAIVVVITGFTAISCVINLVSTPDCPMNSTTSPEGDNAKIYKKQVLQFTVVTLRLILWTILTVAPFFKAAQVNKALNQLRFNLAICNSTSTYAKGVKYMSAEFKFFGISVISALPTMIAVLLFSAIILGSNIKYLNLL